MRCFIWHRVCDVKNCGYLLLIASVAMHTDLDLMGHLFGVNLTVNATVL
ncbi:MAG: hypothetical protein ACI8V2_005454, partial [Candidatus Latescibacterota bacterium]